MRSPLLRPAHAFVLLGALVTACSTGPVTDRKMAEFFAAGDKVQQAHNHKMDVWNRIQESDLAPL